MSRRGLLQRVLGSRWVSSPIAWLAARVLPSVVLYKQRYFDLFREHGLFVLPVHFYEPIPDTRELGEETWTRASGMPGVDMNERAQLELLTEVVPRYERELSAWKRRREDCAPGEFYLENGSFVAVDAEVLHCMVRHHRPARVIEIGSGFSTLVAARALEENAKSDPSARGELTAIEPYPGEPLLSHPPAGLRLLRRKVQEVPLAEFERLRAGDILFVDSSHVVKAGSDVQYEFLEVLPRLRQGVLVHVHDIFLPSEYPRSWLVDNKTFWNEQYLLQAFLAFNDAFEVLWGGSFMHLRHPDKLKAAFASYDPGRNWPASFWMRKTR